MRRQHLNTVQRRALTGKPLVSPSHPAPLRLNPAAGWLETKPGVQLGLLIAVMVSACMVMSDGVLTPAISVISAVEGIKFNTGISTGEAGRSGRRRGRRGCGVGMVGVYVFWGWQAGCAVGCGGCCRCY